MVEEEQTENVPEVKPTFLDEVRKEKEEMTKLRDENKAILEEMKQLKAEDILAGKAPQPKEEAVKEEDPAEYLKRTTGIDLSKR